MFYCAKRSIWDMKLWLILSLLTWNAASLQIGHRIHPARVTTGHDSGRERLGYQVSKISSFNASTEEPEETSVSTSEVTGATVTSGVTATTSSGMDYSCQDGVYSPAVINPRHDMTVLVGTSLELSCTVDPSSNLTSADLRLTRNYESLPTQVKNSSTIIVTEEETEPVKNIIIACENENTGNIFCMRYLTVGYKPLDVVELECKSWNWQLLQCTWRVPDNPAQNPENDYRVYLQSILNDKQDCACDTRDDKGCSSQTPGSCSFKNCCSWDWKNNNYPSAERQLTLIFETENKLGEATFKHDFDNYAAVIPADVENLSVVGIENKLEFLVNWKIPSPIDALGAIGDVGIPYRIDCRPNPDIYGNQDSEWQTPKDGRCHSSHCETSVEFEIPGVVYLVRVRLQSGFRNVSLEEDGWWSEAEPINATSHPEAPRNSPMVGQGSFQTDGSIPGLQDLTVAWKSFPFLYHNGSGFFYNVTATQEGQPLMTDQVTDAFATFTNISSESPVRVEVTSCNDLGCSPNSSVINIQSSYTRPSLPVLPVVVWHKNTQHYELRWYQENYASDMNFTVYYCSDGQEESKPCQGTLRWLNVGNVTTTNLTKAQLELEPSEASGLRFALSTEESTTDQHKLSSGMSWDRCHAPQPYINVTPAPTLQEPLVQSNTAEIRWQLLCTDWGAIVESLEVLLCVGNQNSTNYCKDAMPDAKGESRSGGIRQILTDVSQDTILLDNLKEATQYTVFAKLNYRAGTSNWNRAVFTTNHLTARMAPWKIGVITTSAILIAVALVFLLAYSKRKVRENWNIIHKDVNLPDGLVDDGPKLPPISGDYSRRFSSISRGDNDFISNFTDVWHSDIEGNNDFNANKTRLPNSLEFDFQTDLEGGRQLPGMPLFPKITDGITVDPMNHINPAFATGDISINKDIQALNGYVVPAFPDDNSFSDNEATVDSLQKDNLPSSINANHTPPGLDRREGSNQDETKRKYSNSDLFQDAFPSPGYVALPPQSFQQPQENTGYVPYMSTEKENGKKSGTENNSPHIVSSSPGYIAVLPPGFHLQGNEGNDCSDPLKANHRGGTSEKITTTQKEAPLSSYVALPPPGFNPQTSSQFSPCLSNTGTFEESNELMNMLHQYTSQSSNYVALSNPESGKALVENNSHTCKHQEDQAQEENSEKAVYKEYSEEAKTTEEEDTNCVNSYIPVPPTDIGVQIVNSSHVDYKSIDADDQDKSCKDKSLQIGRNSPLQLETASSGYVTVMPTHFSTLKDAEFLVQSLGNTVKSERENADVECIQKEEISTFPSQMSDSTECGVQVSSGLHNNVELTIGTDSEKPEISLCDTLRKKHEMEEPHLLHSSKKSLTAYEKPKKNSDPVEDETTRDALSISPATGYVMIQYPDSDKAPDLTNTSPKIIFSTKSSQEASSVYGDESSPKDPVSFSSGYISQKNGEYIPYQQHSIMQESTSNTNNESDNISYSRKSPEPSNTSEYLILDHLPSTADSSGATNIQPKKEEKLPPTSESSGKESSNIQCKSYDNMAGGSVTTELDTPLLYSGAYRMDSSDSDVGYIRLMSFDIPIGYSRVGEVPL